MDKNRELGHDQPYKVRMAAGGRIVIPAEVRQALGVKEGDELILSRVDDGYRIGTYRDAIRRAQALFARIKSPGGSLVDDFLHERHEDAEMEEREYRKRYGEK